MRRFHLILPIIAMISLSVAAYGQTSGGSQITRGIGLFGEGKYSEALETFNRVLTDSGSASSRGDAMYWSGLSYIALGDLANARRSLDAFLKEYPRHAQYPDALYQRGRVSYMNGDYEEGIRILGSFLEKYPDHPFFSSALFWTADCLFSLGRLAEAESLFRTILKDYPDSVKYEAANYKLSLIRFKYRENELLTLLKWSHEESLRVIEEFQRREKAYDQALSVYQRKLTEAGVEGIPEGTKPDSRDQEERIATLNARIDELTRALSSGSDIADQTGAESLLSMKSEALDLLASYVDWLAQNVGKEAQP